MPNPSHDPIPLRTGLLDLVGQRFVCTDGREIALSAREAALLGHLAARLGEDVPRDELRREVWGHGHDSLSRAVDQTVKRLRARLEPEGPPRTLLTVQGVGYRLVGAAPEVGPAQAAARPILVGGLRVDLETGLVDGQAALTTQQLALLRVLHAHRGRPVDPGLLARKLGLPATDLAALHTAVYRLRTVFPGEVQHLRGRGFLLRAEAPAPLREVPATLWSLARHAGTVVGVEDCVVYLRDGDRLIQAAAWGPKAPQERALVDPLTLALGQGIVGAAAVSGGLVYVPDTTLDARYVAEDGYSGRSELAVPITHEGRVVGVIDSEAATPGAFDPRRRAGLASLAELAGAVVSDVSRGLRLAS